MAEYSKLYITNNGQALMAKMIAGSGSIDFTKICSSATQYSESQLQALIPSNPDPAERFTAPASLVNFLFSKSTSTP